jgi:hypothetical protein
MKDYVYKPEIIRDQDKLNFRKVITSNDIPLKKIVKHF